MFNLGQKVEIVKKVDNLFDWFVEMDNTIGFQGEIIDTKDGDYKVEFVNDNCNIDWWWYPAESLKAV